MHRMTLGNFELTAFSDGTYPLDGGAFFGVVPKIMWSRKVESDDRNYVTAGLNSLLIRTGHETVLVETGMGNKLSERMVKFYGQPAQLPTSSHHAPCWWRRYGTIRSASRESGRAPRPQS